MTDRTSSVKQDGTTSQILRKITFWRRNNSPRDSPDNDMERSRDTSESHAVANEDVSAELRRFIAGQGAVIKSGYLARKRFKLGIFSKFFVLKDDGHFYCFKNESALQHNGILKLKEVFIVPHGRRSFSVNSHDRWWNMKAKTNEDRDDWIEKLKLARACAQAKEENELEFLSNHQPGNSNANSLSELNLPALKSTLLDLLKGVKSFDTQNTDLRKRYKQAPSRQWFLGWGAKQEDDLQDCLIALSIKMSHVKAAAGKALAELGNAQQASGRLIAENRYLHGQRQRLIEQVEMQAKQLGLIEKATNTKGVKMTQQMKDELKKVEESYTNVPGHLSPAPSETGSDVGSDRGSAISALECFHTAQNTMNPLFSAVEFSCSAPSAEDDGKDSSVDSRTAAPITRGNSPDKNAPKEPEKTTDDDSSRSESSRKQKKIPKRATSTPKAKKFVAKIRTRRTKIPPRREAGFALWSILKNALGKELSRIPLPVDFNEPISFIQRMTECLENAQLLSRAAECSDPVMQMCFVSAFVVSCWGNTPFRTSKPFNPLWSETYECDRIADLGWRSIAEQVSHHPPIGVIKAEGVGWELEEYMQVCSQFQATAMRIHPEGLSTLILKNGQRYSWSKRDVKTIVKGFIMGPLTLHNEGECVITNQTNQFKCYLSLTKQSFFFSPDCRTFSGKVLDRSGKQVARVEGNWTMHFDVVQGKTAAKTRLWTKPAPLPGQEKMYNFSRFTAELNEPEEGVAPTDSRNRPDMRLMEDGDWEKANAEKSRLEQKQREMMKIYTSQLESGKKVLERPVWFKKAISPENGCISYRFQGRYWDMKQKQDWSMCPEIYFNESK